MLLKITSSETGKHGFIVWATPPSIVTICEEEGVASLFCRDRQGQGPTFKASIEGTSASFGQCLEVTLSDVHLLSVLDSTLRNSGDLAIVDHNEELFIKCQAAWGAL